MPLPEKHKSCVNHFLYTMSETAELLSCSRTTLYRWVELGQLRTIRIGSMTRVTDEAIRDFIRVYDPTYRREQEEEPWPNEEGAEKVRSIGVRTAVGPQR